MHTIADGIHGCRQPTSMNARVSLRDCILQTHAKNIRLASSGDRTNSLSETWRGRIRHVQWHLIEKLTTVKPWISTTSGCRSLRPLDLELARDGWMNGLRSRWLRSSKQSPSRTLGAHRLCFLPALRRTLRLYSVLCLSSSKYFFLCQVLNL